MSRRKRFVQGLTDTEQLTLEQGLKYGSAVDFRQRCQTLLLSHKGYEVKQITNMLDVSSQTVYSTMKSWREDGIGGLIRKKGQGRKATLQADNAHHVEATRKAVEKHAQNSRQILEELYAELDIAPMSKRSLQRFLKKVATRGRGSENGLKRSHQSLKSSEKQQK
jgi:transposase